MLEIERPIGDHVFDFSSLFGASSLWLLINLCHKPRLPNDFVDGGFSTSTNTSPDLVYKVTKALFENLNDYKKATKKAKAVTLKAACEGLAFPLHEGAKRYYKEIGHKGCS